MNKIFSVRQKLGQALGLALLISLVALWGAPGRPILAHPIYPPGETSEVLLIPWPASIPAQLEKQGLLGLGETSEVFQIEPTETLTPSAVVPVEVGETATPEPSPTPLPAETPTLEPPQPAAQPVIQVAPADLQLASGSNGTNQIQIEAADGLYGLELRLTFDPETVTVIDADPEQGGVQVGLGPLFQGQDITLAHNRVNNNTGLIELAVSLRQPAPPMSGNGGLITINWQALRPGVAALSLETSLADVDGGAIGHQVTGGQITVSEQTGEPISGRILLQGRTDHSGTQLFLSPEECSTSFQGPGPGVLTTETTSDGSFEFSPLAGTTYACLEALKAGYLSGQKSNPKGDIGSSTLPGGDVTADRIIDVFDLAFLGSHYGDVDTTADINGDGTVSLLDLTITAANYLREGPVSFD